MILDKRYPEMPDKFEKKKFEFNFWPPQTPKSTDSPFELHQTTVIANFGPPKID